MGRCSLKLILVAWIRERRFRCFCEQFPLLLVKFNMKTATLRSRARHYWRQEIRPLLVLALVLFTVRSSLADWNSVPTGSMKPTILEGDRVFVNKLAYDLKLPFTTWHLAEWANPQRGDIVVFFSPHDGTRLVKRVLGLPGDVVELRNDRLIINGNPVEYSPLSAEISGQVPRSEQQQSLFATEQLPLHDHAVMAIPSLPARRNFGPASVPEGQYFVMGDNRDNSYDSRYFGMVERRRIVGKSTVVVVSFDRNDHWLPRLHRFFKPLDAKGLD
jgi:signal peptidase I